MSLRRSKLYRVRSGFGIEIFQSDMPFPNPYKTIIGFFVIISGAHGRSEETQLSSGWTLIRVALSQL